MYSRISNFICHNQSYYNQPERSRSLRRSSGLHLESERGAERREFRSSEAKPLKVRPPPAVVCYAADRNELRSRVIQWLHTEVVPDGWFVKGSNFSDVLLRYFKVGTSAPSARSPC